jgi:hypothetical protein
MYSDGVSTAANAAVQTHRFLSDLSVIGSLCWFLLVVAIALRFVKRPDHDLHASND